MNPTLCFEPPSRTRGPSCAVVGSADVGFVSGPFINKYDRVWRLNDAPTAGFEHLVGMKTTDRIINRVSLMVWSGQQHIEYKEMREKHRRRAFDPSLCFKTVCQLLDRVEPLVLTTAKQRHPNISVAFNGKLRKDATICGPNNIASQPRSAGFVAVIAAMRTCRSPVHLFGFQSDCCNNHTRSYKYYHNERSKWVCCSKTRENMQIERSIFKRLESSGKVNMTVEGPRVPPTISKPEQKELESPVFKLMDAKTKVPRGAIFVACTNSSRSLCAVRQNSSSRMVLIVRDGQIVDKIDDADDPRVFHHDESDWVLNNNYYRPSLIELHSNGSLGREIRIPITESKNLVPISWNRRSFFLMDIRDEMLWPAKLTDKVAVLIKRPIPLRVERSVQPSCPAQTSCSYRGGTQGVHLSNTDGLAYGAGHCTGRAYIKKQWKTTHSAYWWTLSLSNHRLAIEDVYFSPRQLIDPTALYSTVHSGFSKKKNASWSRKVWMLATTEADDAWNTSPNQTYYNQLYRAPRRFVLPGTPKQPVIPRRRQRHARPNFLRRFLNAVHRWFH